MRTALGLTEQSTPLTPTTHPLPLPTRSTEASIHLARFWLPSSSTGRKSNNRLMQMEGASSTPSAVLYRLRSNSLPMASRPASCLPRPSRSFARQVGLWGQIDENTYLLKSDSGSNFRIDSTKCQYSYNLGASSLGPGTYQVNISIGGSVAGSATFALK